MILERVIEILEGITMERELFEQTDDAKALKLGIEVLKRLHLCRYNRFEGSWALLPGETKD